MRLPRTGKRKAEPDGNGKAHGAPQIEVKSMIAGGGHVIGRRAQSRNDDKLIVTTAEQAGNGIAAIEHGGPSEHLGADQALGKQHRVGTLAVKGIGERGGDGGPGVFRPVDAIDEEA